MWFRVEKKTSVEHQWKADERPLESERALGLGEGRVGLFVFFSSNCTKNFETPLDVSLKIID